MLVPTLDLICLHCGWVNSVNDVNEMISILLILDYIKVSSELIRVQVPTNRHKLSRLVWIRLIDKVGCVHLALLGKLLVDIIALSWC